MMALAKEILGLTLESSLFISFPGTGTFGRVVLTRDIPTRQFYALKIMTIAEVIRLRQVEHVNSEKSILASILHPFIVNM